MIACVRWLLLVMFVVVTFPFLCVLLLLNPRKHNNLHLACRAYRWVNRIFGVQVVAAGFDAIAPGRPYIYVANHQSNHDAFIVAQVLPPGTVIVAKQSLRWLPLVGQLYWLTGSLFIDRSNPRASIKSLRTIARQVTQHNTSIWVFPEGTRNPGQGVLPFKSGAFRIAREMGIGIIPVTISCTVRAIRHNRLGPTQVSITAHRPIEADLVASMDAKQLASYTREVISNGLPIV
ncbi:1-acyl-sn-glycerol-3-phosphate acyltransferase [Pseudomonas sp. MAFF212428]|uniref:1-acyl-sn-glycerol-3-phosphate acyltransferase n=1 Tax=Pseudomonas brassicae TaxID=2708063 RepID=A0A6B3NY50_9PSED|nr:lysophospholipid acyltransferase family protein [Pseudomonas brassicae]NER60651.1 1-acyl-sn-glycerol-3-phosphate acyltransferase [Pseudomonas brassicae]NER65120.1 1-acyl-sn-glycerol-3-phosphate acyltransferase [Pseudomonas brassicae]